MEALLDRLGPLRTPVSPFEAFLSTTLLRQVDPDGKRSSDGGVLHAAT